MKNYIIGMLLSFSYFSILPIKLPHFEINKKIYGVMLFTFPFVGLILSLLTIFSFLILNYIFPILYSAFLSAVIYLILYGFLHLEAVCDVIDGWFASLSNKDVYAIMKEPTIGAIGAIGTFLLVLLKLAVITYLLYEQKFAYLLVSLMFSRLAMLICVNIFDFHKNSFIANAFKDNTTIVFIITASILYISIAYFFIEIDFLFMFILSIFTMIISLKVLKNKFGFLNGDCLGFSIEISELIVLNFVLALIFI